MICQILKNCYKKMNSPVCMVQIILIIMNGNNLYQMTNSKERVVDCFKRCKHYKKIKDLQNPFKKVKL